MSKIDEVRSAMVAAMKARDKDRKDSLSWCSLIRSGKTRPSISAQI